MYGIRVQWKFQRLVHSRFSPDLSLSAFKFSETSSDLSKRDLSNRATPTPKLSSVELADLAISIRATRSALSLSILRPVFSVLDLLSIGATHTERAEARGVIPHHREGDGSTSLYYDTIDVDLHILPTRALD